MKLTRENSDYEDSRPTRESSIRTPPAAQQWLDEAKAERESAAGSKLAP